MYIMILIQTEQTLGDKLYNSRCVSNFRHLQARACFFLREITCVARKEKPRTQRG